MTELAKTPEPLTTVGIPMVGDPHIASYPKTGAVRIGAPPDAMMVRRACQYAAALMQAMGKLPADLSAMDAYLEGNSTVVFVAADKTQLEMARFVVPERVMAFDPYDTPVMLVDGRGEQ